LVGEFPFVRRFFGAGREEEDDEASALCEEAAAAAGDADMACAGALAAAGATGSMMAGTSRSDSAPLRGRFRSPLRPNGQSDDISVVVVVMVVVG
jgi:hypothetical protein